MEKLAQAFSARKIPRGAVLLAPGQKIPGVYYLHSGAIRQYSISSGGNELTLHVLFPGAIFPAITLFENSESKYYYEALQSSEVRLIPTNEFEKYLKENTDILFQFAGRLLRGLDGMAKRIEATAFGDSSSRVISILLYLARHFGKENNQEIHITQKFTHQQIASLVGVTRERTSLELEKLKKKKLISYKMGVISIPNIKALEEELNQTI